MCTYTHTYIFSLCMCVPPPPHTHTHTSSSMLFSLSLSLYVCVCVCLCVSLSLFLALTHMHMHMRISTNRTDCICLDGFINYDGEVGGACTACPQGGDCLGRNIGVSLEEVKALEGWYRDIADSDKFYECLGSSWIPAPNQTVPEEGSSSSSSSLPSPAMSRRLARARKSRTSTEDSKGVVELEEHADCPGKLPSDPCSNFTEGILCHMCIEGYHRSKVGDCVKCEESKFSGGFIWACVTTPLAMLFIFAVSKFLRTDDKVRKRKGTLHSC